VTHRPALTHKKPALTHKKPAGASSREAPVAPRTNAAYSYQRR